MKLGILNACTPGEEVEFGMKEVDAFADLFAQSGTEIELVEFLITQGEFPASPEACDAYLITGSPKGAYDDDAWIKQLSEFIVETNAAKQKLVGICFGHQILAHSLGGKAEKSPKGWGMGLKQIEVHGDKSWMEPALPEGSFYFCHQDQVTALPDGAELLAGNDFCENGMFMLGESVLGLQAHPEFSKAIMAKSIDVLSSELNLDAEFVKETRETLDDAEPAGAVMAQWIVNFLKD